jgi:hypothetical protein
VYQIALPPIADARAVEPNNRDLAMGERTALLLAVGVAGGISILAKDSTPFIVSGLLAVALSWSHRHANQVDTSTQKIWNRDSYMGGRRYNVESMG